MSKKPAIVERSGTPQQQEAALAKATARAADHLAVSNAVLARILGLSEASVSRLKNGRYLLAQGSKPFELALAFVRLFRGLDAIMGGNDDSARSWLYGHNLALHGRPIDLIQTIPGLMSVVGYVEASRARV